MKAFSISTPVYVKKFSRARSFFAIPTEKVLDCRWYPVNFPMKQKESRRKYCFRLPVLKIFSKVLPPPAVGEIPGHIILIVVKPSELHNHPQFPSRTAGKKSGITRS
ncbi:MAG: hypothetical protein ACOX8B_08270 [Lachnospiraceae bacterium]|jgi:hypothetical protein